MRMEPFKLERYFAQYEFNTKYLLSSSDCEAMSIQEVLDLEQGAREQFQEHWLGYTESQGAPSLRKEICRIYQNISPEQVLVHSGAEEAIFIFMQAVLNPGDHVIVHWPGYQSLYGIAQSLGCEVSLWVAREENNWKLDLKDMEKLLQKNTRLIVINTPHNPTGYMMDKGMYQDLNDLVRSQELFLFSDEVYRESEHDPDDRLSAACDMGDHAISLGVMSKTYGLAGLRIGWIATQDSEIYQKMARIKDYTTICNSAPSEFLAEIALRHRDRITARNLKIITENLLILDEFMLTNQDYFQWQIPDAGPIAFPRLVKGQVEDFCHRLVNDAGILLLPGKVYDHPGNNFRIGFGRKNMPEAISELEIFLKSDRS